MKNYCERCDLNARIPQDLDSEYGFNDDTGKTCKESRRQSKRLPLLSRPTNLYCHAFFELAAVKVGIKTTRMK